MRNKISLLYNFDRRNRTVTVLVQYDLILQFYFNNSLEYNLGRKKFNSNLFFNLVRKYTTLSASVAISMASMRKTENLRSWRASDFFDFYFWDQESKITLAVLGVQVGCRCAMQVSLINEACFWSFP